MQETNSASGAAARMSVAQGSCAADDIEALRTELSKWQERVPKLASALRERTSEVQALKSRLASGGAADGAVAASAGIHARDTLIRELEAKVGALGGKHQDAEGQLRARDLEITRLRQEAAEWREKWQAVSHTLDARADGAEQQDEEIKRLHRELDELLGRQERHKGRIKEQDLELTALRERTSSLEARNQNLFETTGLANRQIETLGENLEHLRGELKAARQALAARPATADAADAERRAREKEQIIAGLTAETERLTACVNSAEQAAGRFESERRQLSAQLDELNRRREHLEAQLLERSNLVVGLEQEKQAINGRVRALEAENQRLSEALEKTQQATAGNADHIAQMTSRLERQKELMENLEAEFAEVQEQHSEVVRAHQRSLKEKEAELANLRQRNEAPSLVPEEVSTLQAEVIKLEGMLRERTEQLNKLRWQQEMLEKQGTGDPSDSRMLMILNQQLDAARDENRRLKEILKALQGDSGGCSRDDLSRIRGVGPKLVTELENLGITRFDQIATLSESDLDDPEHPLHAMKGRVIKDDWIAQAARLGRDG